MPPEIRVTDPLAGSTPSSYLYALRIGAGILTNDSRINNCEFYDGICGIFFDPNTIHHFYPVIINNVFNRCQYGVGAIDSFARIL